MKEVEIDFIPTYEYLKSLPTDKEYVFHLFHIMNFNYFRITYNEEFNKMISVDYIVDGYLHSVSLPIRHKTKIIENTFYKLNKKNYIEIIKFVKLCREAILNDVGDNKWELTEENSLNIH